MIKTKELIDALMAVAFGHKDLESQRVRLHDLCVHADKETLELEAKVQELDRREKGTTVHSRYIIYGGVEYGKCGWCNQESMRRNNYCGRCGTKLLWQGDDTNERD